jgi:hypothetical protein
MRRDPGSKPITRTSDIPARQVFLTISTTAKQKPAHIARNVRKPAARGRFCALQHSCIKRMPVMQLLQLYVARQSPIYRSPPGHTALAQPSD